MLKPSLTAYMMQLDTAQVFSDPVKINGKYIKPSLAALGL